MTTRRRTSIPGLLLLAACMLGGCTISKIKADNEAIEQSIGTKERELQRAQQQQAEIDAEQQRLLNDLRTRELTLAEMSARLQELERRNAAAPAVTEEQRRVKAQREKALDDARNKVREVERAPDQSAQAKARRLKEVREELRKTLELLAKT